MGFSVSGSTAIIFVGMFIALGVLQPAVSNGFERVEDARSADADRLLDERNTDIDATELIHDTAADEVTLVVTNTGTTTLNVDDVDVIYNGSYESSVQTTVAGNSTTGVWLPGETLRATVSVPDANQTGARAVVVTEHGVSDAEVVS
ncbi:flagellin [Halobium salinum]|uniref:Flagellin n=1 Tax=Halobium salinum TaxID=1364940 RepID=A0ABD5PHJ7_9EURY|nr:flagellin [Halobium salinum]